MGTSQLIDQFDVNKNFGVAPNSRKQLFNAVYAVDLPRANVNKWAGGFVNGWQVTGIVQIESGPNLTGYQNQNFGMNLNNAMIPGNDLRYQQRLDSGHSRHPTQPDRDLQSHKSG